MAVPTNIKELAEGILSSLSSSEVGTLVKVLDYYNTKCTERRRAACLRYGCKGGGKPAGVREMHLTERLRKSTDDVYISGPASVCPCCNR